MEREPPGSLPERRRTVTAADVARATGVSGATVSYVLNDTPGKAISEATRRRVRDAAVRLRYTPSAAARTLAAGRSTLVLLLVRSQALVAPSFAQFVQEVGRELRAHGLAPIVHIGSEPGDIAQAVMATSPAMVVPFMRLDRQVQQAADRVGARIPPELDRVTNDVIAEAGRLQVRYLASRGHRRLVYAGSTEESFQQDSTTRLEGVTAACRDLGLPAPLSAAVPPDLSAAEAALRGWAALADPPTAVCAYNDDVAHTLLAGLWKVGGEPDGRLAVMGVDDAPFARTSVPPLTTIEIASVEGGRALAGALWAFYIGEPPGSSWTAPGLHRVVARESA